MKKEGLPIISHTCSSNN